MGILTDLTIIMFGLELLRPEMLISRYILGRSAVTQRFGGCFVQPAFFPLPPSSIPILAPSPCAVPHISSNSWVPVN